VAEPLPLPTDTPLHLLAAGFEGAQYVQLYLQRLPAGDRCFFVRQNVVPSLGPPAPEGTFLVSPAEAAVWVRARQADRGFAISTVALEWARAQAAATPPAPPAAPCILYLGKRTYQIGECRPRVLTPREDFVLRSFLRDAVMDGDTLENASGVSRAARVLRALKTKFGGEFGGAIDLPGDKTGGGYHVNIRDASGPQQAATGTPGKGGP
jgi:hypothetical protein